MSRTSQVILVLEDEHHKKLIYRYLRNCGFKSHQIRLSQSPSGRGSAENWVRKQFVQEVSAYRARHAQTALILVIDADTNSVLQRLNQLDQELQAVGKASVSKSERIAQLVPKRNIETWILCLNGTIVDEDSDYKTANKPWNELIRSAAITLSDATQPNSVTPAHYIDSLRRGISELRHLRA